MKKLIQLLAVLALTSLSSSNVVNSGASDQGNFELLILHNNDMHARFEQTSQLSGECTVDDREAGKCYGGFPRVAHVVKEARKAAASGEGPPVLYLNAGDTYTGTAWFTIYKWQIAAELVNALQPDAVSLGNHEFDEAVDGVIPFIRNLSSPVLAANLILNNVPELLNVTNLYKSVILTRNNIKIGIIGYLTPDTKFLAPLNKVEYEDEIIAINREVKKLKNNGVGIFIALGHSGIIKDLEIAKKVDGIDLVIGGHSNTFLWNSNTTAEKPEYPQGPYPTVVEQSSGRRVLVVQAYAYTKYMGRLHLVFDTDGEIIKYDGMPILLNHDIPRDPELLETINEYRDEVDRIKNRVVGSSLVFLDGESCRLRECNIGNMITDSILNYTKQNYYKEHPDVNIALIQGGRIRASIDRSMKPFNLTWGDWVTVLPFSDNLTVLTMNGTVLMQALEHSVKEWQIISSPGQFLQLSGIHVIYDLSKPPGYRVIKAKALCHNCKKSTLTDIRNNHLYRVVLPSFLAESGDGYTMFKDLPKETLPYNEVTCVLDYVSKYSPINTYIQGRITVLNEDNVSNAVTMSTFTNKAKGRQLNSKGVAVYATINLYIVFGIVTINFSQILNIQVDSTI